MMFTEKEIIYEIVKKYMNKELEKSVLMAINYINSKRFDVSDEYFDLLLDMFQVLDNQVEFVKLSKYYSQKTGKMQRVWEHRDKGKQEMFSNGNLFIATGAIDNSSEEKLNEFENKCLETKFGRIDFNKIDLLKSNYWGLNRLLHILYKFKESEANIIIMGDNKILKFDLSQIPPLKQEAIRTYENKNSSFDLNKINSDVREKILYEVLKEIDNIEETIFLLQMELKQWKGEEREYKEKSLEYFDKYKKFPPTYKKEYEKMRNADSMSHNGVTSIENVDNIWLSGTSNEVLKFHIKEINVQNLNYITDYLNHTDNNIIFIDLKSIDYFSYDAAQDLLLFIQNYRKNKKYDIYMKNLNSMIKNIFEMIGLENYICFD